MAELEPNAVRRQLARKFKFAHTGGSKHDGYDLIVDGRLVAAVDVIRGSEPCRDALIGRMAKQAHVSPRTFRGMISCTVSRNDYLKLLGIDEGDGA